MAEERLLWEDLTEGDVAISSGRTITETDVVNFCGLSGDFNWFHVNAVAAKESVFGQRVAHGMLVASIATGLQVGSMEPKIATAAFMGLREWQFSGRSSSATRSASSGRSARRASTKNPAQGVVIYEVEVINQDDKVVQKGEWNMLIRRREA